METSEKDTKLSILNYSNWAFKSNALKLAEIVSEAAISDNIIDMQELFMEATLDSVCKVILGVDLDTMRGTYKEGTEFSNAFDEASAAAMFRYFNFLWRIMRFFNIGSEGVLRKSLSVMDEFVYELIRNKIEQVQKPQDNLPGRKETCCQGLENWKKTDPKDLRDISLSFILAGKDTTEITLSWFFYEICKNSSVQEKIEQEIRETTNVAAGSIIDELAARVTEVNLEKMQYLHASLNVTLRLHPAVPVQGKFCFSDDTWPDWI